MNQFGIPPRFPATIAWSQAVNASVDERVSGLTFFVTLNRYWLEIYIWDFLCKENIFSLHMIFYMMI
jgi:hypothetical protein